MIFNILRINNYKLLIITLISISVISPSFSQQQATKITGSPLMSFVSTEHDFGTVKSGDEAVHYFVYTNTGDAPLVISNVRSSCGCAVPEWPKNPLGMGKKDSLRVEYNTRIKGVFDKTIMVYSNTPSGITELRIKGNVVKK